MSRTACCFVALGISFAAFAAACGDDDGGGGTGGNGGNGASGGSGGSAGSASTAGEGGSAGTVNTAGEGGTAGAGTAGTAGSGNAGTAGAGNAGAAGTTGVVETDAGPDSGTEPDSGIVDAGNNNPPPVTDGGVNGDCNFVGGIGSLAEQTGQDYVISHVVFDADGTTAHVTLRAVIAQTFGDPQQLCSGPTDAECVAVDDDVIGERPAGTEITVDLPDISPDAGEIAFVSELPSADGAFALAYVNWGDYASPDPVGTQSSLEDLAILGTGADNFWTADESITLGSTQNAFFVSGDTAVAAGFTACTATNTN